MFDVIAFCKAVLDTPEVETLDNPGKPYVAPESQPVEVDFEALVSSYKPEAIATKTFEEFIALVEKIVLELALNPANDLTKVAGVLNKYRIENNLEPL